MQPGYSDIKAMKERMKTTAKIGRLIGRRICVKVWNCVAPSMRAASSMLAGIVSKYPLSIQM